MPRDENKNSPRETTWCGSPPECGWPDVPPAVAPASSSPFLWPLVLAAAANEAAASCFNEFVHALVTNEAEPRSAPEPQWTTPHRVVMELQSLQLRDFSCGSDGVPALVCAPFALHAATVADFAPGHSLVETLRNAGLNRVFVAEWRSATPEMRFLSIDNYLADLNVAVDEIGSPVDLIGLCQGGWMALVYAARFPAKVRRLVLAGAPIDLHAGESAVSRMAADVPLAIFDEVVRLGDGRILGDRALDLWGPVLDSEGTERVLELPSGLNAAQSRDLQKRFREWYAWTVNLPGTYCLQVVRWLFKENQIAAGRFVALGRTIDLAEVKMPVFLLAARDDQVVSPDQLLACADLVGTPKNAIETMVEPCGHLSLFIGAQTLRRTWPKIAQWLRRDAIAAAAA